MFGNRTIWFKLLSEIFSIVLTLAILHYASESFGFKKSELFKDQASVFIFLLVGEISLILPLSVASRWLNHYLNLVNQQFYQTLIGLKINYTEYIFSQVLIDLLFPIIRIIIIIAISIFLFNLELTLNNLLLFLLIQIMAIFIFYNLAAIAGAIYSLFHRGFSIFHTLQTVFSILGGAYFPTAVFPSSLKSFSSMLPQTQILQMSRNLFSNGLIATESWFILMFWMILTGAISWFLGTKIQGLLKKRAKYFV